MFFPVRDSLLDTFQIMEKTKEKTVSHQRAKLRKLLTDFEWTPVQE